jgi:hypothetical protein
MAKKGRNSGFERQAAVMGQFTRDAKSKSTGESAAEIAMKDADKRAAYRAEQEAKKSVRVSFKFLSTGK